MGYHRVSNTSLRSDDISKGGQPPPPSHPSVVYLSASQLSYFENNGVTVITNKHNYVQLDREW